MDCGCEWMVDWRKWWIMSDWWFKSFMCGFRIIITIIYGLWVAGGSWVDSWLWVRQKKSNYQSDRGQSQMHVHATEDKARRTCLQQRTKPDVPACNRGQSRMYVLATENKARLTCLRLVMACWTHNNSMATVCFSCSSSVLSSGKCTSSTSPEEEEDCVQCSLSESVTSITTYVDHFAQEF